MGANTTAVDASGTNISVAQTHAALDPSFIVPNSLVSSSVGSSSASVKGKGKFNLNYRHCAAEDLVKEGKMFDVVCAMEVIEHVDDPRGFLDCLSDLTKVR